MFDEPEHSMIFYGYLGHFLVKYYLDLKDKNRFPKRKGKRRKILVISMTTILILVM